jgi:hypothetical protein
LAVRGFVEVYLSAVISQYWLLAQPALTR